MNRSAAGFDRCYCLAEVDIFADLTPAEMDTLAAVARVRTYAAGELLYSPQNLVEALFILKQGRVRAFRVTADGRAFTVGIINPGTIFGEIVLLGQPRYDSYAEALDEAVVCVMSRDHVVRHLLPDPRIAARIAETLCRRLVETDRRLSDMALKSVHQRVAATLAALAGDRLRHGAGIPNVDLALTHEQLAALVGTSHATAAKVLGELADRGLVRLTRGKVIVLDVVGIAAEAGDLSRIQRLGFASSGSGGRAASHRWATQLQSITPCGRLPSCKATPVSGAHGRSTRNGRFSRVRCPGAGYPAGGGVRLRWQAGRTGFPSCAKRAGAGVDASWSGGGRMTGRGG